MPCVVNIFEDISRRNFQSPMYGLCIGSDVLSAQRAQTTKKRGPRSQGPSGLGGPLDFQYLQYTLEKEGSFQFSIHQFECWLTQSFQVICYSDSQIDIFCWKRSYNLRGRKNGFGRTKTSINNGTICIGVSTSILLEIGTFYDFATLKLRLARHQLQLLSNQKEAIVSFTLIRPTNVSDCNKQNVKTVQQTQPGQQRLPERSRSSSKGRTSNIGLLVTKLNIVAIYAFFETLSDSRAFNESHPDPAFVELSTKVILFSQSLQ